jgi:DNA-directed RNA polymerase alpha subunit
MNVTELEDGEDVLKVEIEGINEAEANALRRGMMVKAPTLAVKHIEVSSNDSGLFDEMLANRIGQVPFTIPENVEEGDEVNIAVKREGPVDVVADDIQADNDEAEPVNPETVLVTLKEDQKLELEGVAVLNTGDKHAKHQGGTIGYEKTGENTFEFRIESTSGYSNRELFDTAVEEILEELEEFEETIEEEL